MKPPFLSRREFLRCTGLAAGAALVPLAGCSNESCSCDTPVVRPNIIFILADDLGWGDLGCYGQKETRTPHLDRLAAEGMRFTQHYAGSTVCAPSRCVLMTGLNTGHARIRGNGLIPLEPNDVTVARLLQQAGYRTALIGKWGLGEQGTTGHPNHQGFEYFFGYLNQTHAHNYYPAFLWRNEEKVALSNIVEPPASGADKGQGVSTNKLEYSHDLIAAEALQFVTGNKDRPFFLYLAFTIPHANNEAKDKGMEVPDLGIYRDKDWPEPEKGRAAMISRMDSDVGRLIDRLRSLGIASNTLVLFSSDNGPHKEGGSNPDFLDCNGPLRGIKRDLYEGGIRVPCIASWPGTIDAGTVCEHVCGFQDFLPTACEAVGIATPPGLDGISYLPALLGRPQPEHEFLYWEFHEGGFKQAVRTGDFKAVRFGLNGKTELYNLKTDLGETRDIAQQHPDVLARIDDFLKSARTDSPHWKPK